MSDKFKSPKLPPAPPEREVIIVMMEEAAEVAKECNEFIQRCSKALRFGLDEIQPGQDETNGYRIGHEFGELEYMVGIAIKKGVIPLGSCADGRFSKAEKWAEFQQAHDHGEPVNIPVQISNSDAVLEGVLSAYRASVDQAAKTQAQVKYEQQGEGAPLGFTNLSWHVGKSKGGIDSAGWPAGKRPIVQSQTDANAIMIELVRDVPITTNGFSLGTIPAGHSCRFIEWVTPAPPDTMQLAPQPWNFATLAIVEDPTGIRFATNASNVKFKDHVDMRATFSPGAVIHVARTAYKDIGVIPNGALFNIKDESIQE